MLDDETLLGRRHELDWKGKSANIVTMSGGTQNKCPSCDAPMPQRPGQVVVCSYCGAEIKLDSIAPKSPVLDSVVVDNASSSRWGVGIFAVAVAVVILVGGLWVLVGEKTQTTSVSSDVMPVEAAAAPQVPINTVELAPFVLNIPGADGPHYLKAKVSFTLSDSRAKDAMKRRNDLIRDAAGMILGELTFEQAQIPKEHAALKSKIKRGVEMIVGDGTVTKVDFIWFTVQ